MDDVPFAITSSDAVYSKFEVSKDSVVLFKKVSLKFCLLNSTFGPFEWEARSGDVVELLKAPRRFYDLHLFCKPIPQPSPQPSHLLILASPWSVNILDIL